MRNRTINILVLIILAVGSSGWYVKHYFFKDSPETMAHHESPYNGINEHLFQKEMYLDAKLDDFENLNDVEQTTDEIVIAQKISQEEPTIIYGKEGRIDIAYTLSTFQVKKSILNKNLKEGDYFTMLENEAYNSKEDITYHIAGYNLIKENKNYLLFLRQSETDPYYIVAGVNYGKVNLEDSSTDHPKGLENANTEYSKEILFEYSRQEKIRKDAIKKYSSVIDEFMY